MLSVTESPQFSLHARKVGVAALKKTNVPPYDVPLFPRTCITAFLPFLRVIIRTKACVREWCRSEIIESEASLVTPRI